ncbi:MAG: HEPN domain-containing protein [Parcubacteria group bacterium]|nr:HEPN domain-containing protein [Parcubacteria group bacterium]
MQGKNRELALEWSKKAEEDEFAGVELLKAAKFAAPVCFHFQQMVEKLLKALLVFEGKSFPKTHDLIALASIAEPEVTGIRAHKSDLELLNRYYIEARYPGDFPEISLAECQEARDAAGRIKEFVVNAIQSVG